MWGGGREGEEGVGVVNRLMFKTPAHRDSRGSEATEKVLAKACRGGRLGNRGRGD